MSDNQGKPTNVTKSEVVISPQARLAALGYSLIVIAMIVMIIISNGEKGVAIARLATYIIISIISIYAVNCTVVGSCNLYAWIVGYLMIIMGLVVVTTLITTLYRA
jgi:uncharacterized membrane protein